MSRLETPELQLLTRCASTRPTEEDATVIRRCLEGPLDMGAVLVAGYRQQVLSLLYHNLAALCPDAVPAGLLAQLRSRYEQQHDRSIALARELIRFRNLLAGHGIDCVPLKGPAIAVGVYGDLSLRGFRDLDFLLLPQDIRRAKDLLAGLGYGIMPQVSGARERSYWQSECEWSMGNPEDTACIEIHWAVRERCFAFPLHPAELWERLISITIEGEPVRTLGREDLLLVLSVHGSKHCWDRMKWICDIAELLRAEPALDWDHVLRTAHRLHAVRLVLVAVQLAAELLHAPVPPEVAALMKKHPTVSPLVHTLLDRLFASQPDDVDSARRQLLYLSMRERVQERAAFVYGQLTTPTERDWTSIPLPDWLFPCYRFIRPCRLATGYASSGLAIGRERIRRRFRQPTISSATGEELAT